MYISSIEVDGITSVRPRNYGFDHDQSPQIVRKMFDIIDDHPTICGLCSLSNDREWHSHVRALNAYRDAEMSRYGVEWNPDIIF